MIKNCISILSFKFRKIKSDFPRGNNNDFFWRKRRILPSETKLFFQKNGAKKQWFQLRKHEKYLKSKNDVKRRLGAFNQELWAIFKFDHLEIWELFPPRKTAQNSLDGKRVSAPQKLSGFWKNL